MLFMTLRWLVTHVSASLSLLAQSKARMSAKQIWRGIGFVLGKDGFYTNIIPSLFVFFKPGFHPAKDIKIEEGLDHDLHHFHVEKHFVEVVEHMR